MHKYIDVYIYTYINISFFFNQMLYDDKSDEKYQKH